MQFRGTFFFIKLSNYMKERVQKAIDEDAEIIDLCKRGNIDAFEILVNKYQKKMINISYRIIGNYEEACEIVQDAFVSAYKNMKCFRHDAKFSTWLYTIAVNLSRNRLKQLKVQGYREEPKLDDPVEIIDQRSNRETVSVEPSILEKIEKRENQELVHGCINSLDLEFKEVIVLRDIQGFSYEEMSDMLNIKEGTIKSRLFRARESLKNCLKRVLGNL